MKSSIKIILFVIPLILLVVLILTVWKKEKKETTISIDYTEDVKGLGYSGQRKVAQDSLGNYFVTYRKKYQGKYQIFVTRISNQKGDWKINGIDKPAAIIDSIADQRVPSILVTKDNEIYIVWYGSDGSEKDQKNNRQIKFIKSENSGSSWSEVKNISNVEGFDSDEEYWQEHPYLLADDNNLYVVWEGKDKDNKNQQIKFSRSSDKGKTWNSWKNILATPENTQSRPTMVLTNSGRLHLFSYSSSENPSKNQQIKHTWSDDQGDSWNKWTSLTDASLDSRHASVTQSNDSVHITWRQINVEGKSQILYKALNGDEWNQPILIKETNNNQLFPSISIVNGNKIAVTWMENSESSELPREDPREGKIFIATMNKNKFDEAVEISSDKINLYPNLPVRSEGKFIPVVYEKFQSENRYDIILKLLDG